MKIATHVLVFGQEKWLMRNLENAYPHVDRIYLSMSYDPWSYNPQAKGKYKNTFHANLIFESRFDKYRDKIVAIAANWNTEEEQRNACVDQAIADGMDYLIIHDADEFYYHNQFEAAINEIKANPDHDYYAIAWYCFWKSFGYILLDADGKQICGYPQFAINLKRGVRFESKRRPNKTDCYTISTKIAVCYHASYVLTNEEVYQKINTWGHANDFDRERWYKEVWLAWKPTMKNLHLVLPQAWSKADHFDGGLPEVINDLK